MLFYATFMLFLFLLKFRASTASLGPDCPARPAIPHIGPGVPDGRAGWFYDGYKCYFSFVCVHCPMKIPLIDII